MKMILQPLLFFYLISNCVLHIEIIKLITNRSKKQKKKHSYIIKMGGEHLFLIIN